MRVIKKSVGNFLLAVNSYLRHKRALLLSIAFERDFNKLYRRYRGGEFESKVGKYFSYRFYRQGDYLTVELRRWNSTLPFHIHTGEGWLWKAAIKDCKKAIYRGFYDEEIN